MITEYDNRQLVKMRERLDLFRRGQLSLETLISDVEFLLDVMESMDKEWTAKVGEEVGTLEQVFAFALYKEWEQLDKRSESLVSQSAQKISEYLSELGI